MREEITEKLRPGALYVVGTPIGNLGDLSPRAAETLAAADFIAAEDTRVTLKLLNHLGLKKPLFSYFEHNKLSHGEAILRRLRAGESCALVTDAGMPAISDPGETLIAACAAEGLPIFVTPGPTALISALAVSGLPTGRFCFEGFLPVPKKERRARLNALSNETRTMIFYEAPHKLSATLADLAETLGGERKIAVARELTKLHEEVWRGDLAGALKRWTEPRGEFVLVVAGAEPARAPETSLSPAEAAALAREKMAAGLSASEAAKEAARQAGLKKGDVYRLLVPTEKT